MASTVYRYLQRQAHEQPVYFWSILIGLAGPAMLVTVPPIRRRMGYVRPEDPPYTYPLPRRERRATVGFEDPEEWAGKWDLPKRGSTRPNE
ncbi:hypothetical protein DACRYDRAFT_71132 [Dacryopinax primogenitus]|uniref:NADH-ubiquinone oxidoreductase 9.5 kDa subunit n=1 Tax=Dacryopinax primogenitus (strain DJM 731) TaxID=1858805 RepID=M5FR25_DACPD|nr:uncharacterized protein DACRYDRAFT_71132 [Dacryopinax primogenitus]EJT98058.1 hypothetical protein DACRYDRAFT_71132 [Dacryopinax primogenitus]